MNMVRVFSVNIVAAVAICLGFVSIASADCGEVVTPAGFYYGGDPEERVSIDNCDNPFNADTPDPFTYQLAIADQSVGAGSVVVLPAGTTTKVFFSTNNDNPMVFEGLSLYRKDGSNYYLESFHDNPGEEAEIAMLLAGEYVAVLTRDPELIPMAALPLWRQIVNTFFLPTVAYAYYPDSTEVVAVSFTIEYEVPAVTGASSVLFLPGIQASRLYTDGALGTENQLWEPNINNDVKKLEMTEGGDSLYDIYTKDVLDEIYGVSNIYKGFLDLLDDMVANEEIASTTAFAYDWRYDVSTVATQVVQYTNGETKRLVEEVERLAASSFTGKVTIIGHSNGGLVAKALLHEYGSGELAGKVDKLIMVGTPQLGTPKAIGALLHGLEQGSPLGFAIDTATAREVTRNMPGAYTLLPSVEYFSNATTSLITTDGKPTTQSVSRYGDILSNESLVNFMLDTYDQWPEEVTIHEPLELNASIMASNQELQQALNSFVAPEGVAVYEVVGVGLPTIRGFEYREFSCAGSVTCIVPAFAKPIPLYSTQGDQTVMAVSASGYQGDKTVAYVDLLKEGNQLSVFEKEHKNMTESQTIQEFLTAVIKYPYLSDTMVVPQDFTEVTTEYTIIGAHSPVTLLLEDGDGNQVGFSDGVLKEDIIGSQYFELGSSKYAVVPSSESYSVLLTGEANGNYSLTIDEFSSNYDQKNLQTIVGLPVTPTTHARFTLQAGEFSPILADVDGDGSSDVQYNWDGSTTTLEKTGNTSDVVVVDSKKKRGGVKQVSVTKLTLAPIGNVASAPIVQPRSLNKSEKELYDLLVELQKILITLIKQHE